MWNSIIFVFVFVLTCCPFSSAWADFSKSQTHQQNLKRFDQTSKIEFIIKPKGHNSNTRPQNKQAVESLLKAQGARDDQIKRLPISGFMVVQLPKTDYLQLLQSGLVEAVYENTPLEPNLAGSLPFIGAITAHNAGHLGNETAVAILDTGIDAEPEYLAGRITHEACFSRSNSERNIESLCPDGNDLQLGLGAAAPCASSSCNHGTHVASIAAAVAPAADIVAVQVFSRYSDPQVCKGASDCIRAQTADVLEALHYLNAKRASFSSRLVAVNLSLGHGIFESNCNDSAYAGVISDLYRNNIATVTSAGNSGSSTGVSSPACVSRAIAVGSVNDATKTVSSFSNSSSLLDLWAPGDGIYAALPGNRFGRLSGTSMAAPLVTGAFAVVASAAPKLSVSQIQGFITEGGALYKDPRNNISRPVINVSRAVEKALSTPVCQTGKLVAKNVCSSSIPSMMNAAARACGSACGIRVESNGYCVDIYCR